MLQRTQRRDVNTAVVGDLRATEITMNDDDRIQLMLLVKEGKISVQEAVDTVRFAMKQLRVYYGLIHADAAQCVLRQVCLTACQIHEHVLCQMNFTS